MFSEPRFYMEQSKNFFAENVRDAFGESIVDQLYNPVLNEMGRLQMAYDQAEGQKIRIQMKLGELRMIL